MRLFFVIIIGLGLVFAKIKYLEKKGIFHPVKQVLFDPSLISLPFQDIYLTCEDGIKINAWFIPQPQAKYTIIFCHGNAGNIGDRIDKLNLLHNAGVNIFIMDYRGFGNSQGSPTEEGIYLDAQAAYDYLLDSRNLSPGQIILYGESIGTAVVVDLGSKKKVGALILEGAFSNGRDMARKLYPFLPRSVFSNIFDSLTKINRSDAPKLFIHSRNDEVVPLPLARKLYDTAKEPKEFIELHGSHNEAFLESEDKFISAIASFIKRLP